MHLISIYLYLMLFFLMTVSPHLRDAEDSINSCNTPTTNRVKIDDYRTVMTLNTGGPPLKGHPSDTQSTSPQHGRHSVRIVTAAILLASIVWSLRKCLGGSTQDGTRGLSTHHLGRSDAVSGRQVSLGSPEDAHSQHDTDPIKTQSRHKRPATVVSAGVPPYHTQQPYEYLLTTSQEPATPYYHAFRRFVVAVCRILRTWVQSRVSRPGRTVVCLTVHQRDPSSLRRSLHKGSRDLGEGSPEVGQCSFLVVGVDTLGHKDAENDTEYLRQMFESSAYDSTTHRYQYLYGSEATYAEIRKAVRAILGGARAILEPTQIFMLFTGTGDENNAMCLSNGQVLSESDLRMWLPISPTDQANKLSVGILFDICRSTMSRLAAVLQSVELAWSCSVGEFAYAIRISEDKLIPRSIFLLAIFLAAHDMKVHNLDGCCFEAAFTFHVRQLSELILFMYRREHQVRCPRCPTHKKCDAPVAQNPDLQQAGRVVTSLGMLIATHFSQHASEVFAAVDHKMLQEKFPGRLLCPLSLSRAKQANKPTVKDES